MTSIVINITTASPRSNRLFRNVEKTPDDDDDEVEDDDDDATENSAQQTHTHTHFRFRKICTQNRSQTTPPPYHKSPEICRCHGHHPVCPTGGQVKLPVQNFSCRNWKEGGGVRGEEVAQNMTRAATPAASPAMLLPTATTPAAPVAGTDAGEEVDGLAEVTGVAAPVPEAPATPGMVALP